MYFHFNYVQLNILLIISRFCFRETFTLCDFRFVQNVTG